MKRLILSLFVIVALIGVTACSSTEKKGQAAANEVDPRFKEYDQELKSVINQSSKILISFNKAIDDSYTNRISANQFGQLTTKSIDESTEMIKKFESLEVDSSIFEFHQQVILLLNNQHQLLLDAVDMANTDEEIDKEDLRSTYLEIKGEHAAMANSWKGIVSGETQESRKKR